MFHAFIPSRAVPPHELSCDKEPMRGVEPPDTSYDGVSAPRNTGGVPGVY
jgi:hypothetical protein